MNRRRSLRQLAAALLGLALPVLAAAPARAQDKTVRIIVPYPAGGNADNIARLYGDALAKKLGQPVIVENKPGGGAMIGAQAAARSPGDGSVLFMAPTAVFVVTPHLRATPYDAQKDFIPVAKITSWIPVMVTRKDFPGHTLAEVVAEVKRHPGKYTFGSAGPATMTHLMGELMNQKLGMNTVHVPYKGSADLISEVVSGRIDIAYDSVLVPQVKAGQVQAVASMVALRNPDLPSVPTLKELGTDIDVPNWYGLFVPRGTPQAVVDRLGALSREIVAGLDKDQLGKMSMKADYQDPAAFKAQIGRDDALMRDVIQKANIRLE
ncbi:Bug family tripartite tricarboxylate transporter substrate binding protein [Cupriavidus basilensis]|uniref:Bug family tripartite tricarboxylate transporter substrate binding protein n=1 Tax=Cupriavidus basilensis TaxID=68895 RepID=UPI0007507F41|nr:tripartite tricarboxylate transporter substrate binding protein [Cupriavidus basilensis]